MKENNYKTNSTHLNKQIKDAKIYNLHMTVKMDFTKYKCKLFDWYNHITIYSNTIVFGLNEVSKIAKYEKIK